MERRQMPNGIIFDIDGTLVDSVDLHARAWSDALKKFGHEPPLAEIRKQIGKGSDQLLPVFLDPKELDKYGKQLEFYRSELFKRDYLAMVRAFPRVRELFLHIIQRGQKIALASSAKSDELATYKRIAGIEDLVEVATSSDDAEKSKPDPDIFSAALEKLKIGPSEAIVVGDTRYDVEAATTLNVRAIGLLCGGSAENVLRKAGCIAVYRDPADLLTRYDGSPLATF
jgi:HAD superfamily hydrolase (TIGR01509 family)